MRLRDRFRFLLRRRHAFRIAFGTPEGQFVLRDIKKFCGADNEQYTPGSFEDTAYQLGKRRVWLRIQKTMNLSDAELARLSDTTEEAEDGD